MADTFNRTSNDVVSVFVSLLQRMTHSLVGIGNAVSSSSIVDDPIDSTSSNLQQAGTSMNHADVNDERSGESPLRFMKGMKGGASGGGMVMLLLFGFFCFFGTIWIWRHHITAWLAQYVSITDSGKASPPGREDQGGRKKAPAKVMPTRIAGYEEYGGRGFRPPDFDEIYDREAGPAPPPSPPRRSKNIVRHAPMPQMQKATMPVRMLPIY